MSPRTKQQFKKIRNEKIELIKNTALKLFAENGYASTSISKIANNAKISKGLIYNYFESKEALLHDVMFDSLKDFANALVVEDINNIKKKEIIQFIDWSFNTLKSNPEFYKLYFSLAQQGQIIKLFEEEMHKVFGELFEKIIMYYTQKGEKNPFTKARFLIAIVDGIGAHYLLDMEGFPLEETRKMITELI